MLQGRRRHRGLRPGGLDDPRVLGEFARDHLRELLRCVRRGHGAVGHQGGEATIPLAFAALTIAYGYRIGWVAAGIALHAVSIAR